LQRRCRNFEIHVEGYLRQGVTAKDVILAIIAQTGVSGGNGHVFEYTGSAIRGMDMEARMTICNMSIEAGARAGLIGPDDTTFNYLAGRPFAPEEEEWDAAVTEWRRLRSDRDAEYNKRLSLDGTTIEPMISFGTNPSMNIPIHGRVPDPDHVTAAAEKAELQRAIEYMGLRPGQSLLGHSIDVVFIGSCTNSRLTDLRAAAGLLRDRRIHPKVRAIVVPGSQAVKREAEAEGLHHIFKTAGAEWREPGCSMCIAMNGDQLEPGQRAVSTSNRNFEGRQGPGGRTFLASPLTAAASAIAGVIADPRKVAVHASV
jgi:3-isopropylmalate/(R)-2-methylmalate dehydratase large subunit